MANFRFDIDINARSTGVDQAKAELQQLKLIMNQIEQDPTSIHIDSDTVEAAKRRIRLLEESLREAEEEGRDLGEVLERNMRQAQLATQRTTREVEQLNRALRQIQVNSIAGSRGLTEISKSAKLATQNIKSTSEYMDRLKNNMIEGFGQTVAFGSIMAVSTAISEAVQTAVQLDKVMTQISIVSGKSAEQMEAYRDAAGAAADVLGTTAKEFMEAALIYEQQGGLAQTYAQELGRATVIGANIDDTGKTAEEISEYITAVMNGFEMLETKGGKSGMYIMDVLSRLGSVSGSALNEMSEGLQRVSNLARTSGFEFEEISAAIATVSETTRRSASTIGNAFKSILVSFQQIREASDEEQEEFTSKIEKAFKATGMSDISVFDNGELREAKAIMDDIGERWSQMDVNQKAQVSEAIAGKYHAEVFQAFMENQERYHALTEEAFDSEGTAMRQQLIYMDSLESKVQALKNAWQSASSAVIENEVFEDLIGGATKFLNIIGETETAIGGIFFALGPVAALFMSLFGGRMVQGAAQVKMAKNFVDLTRERLQVQGQLNEAIEKELSMGEKQQKIARNLGEHAGSIYKQNVETLQALKDQKETIEKAEQIISEKTTNKFNAFEASGFTRTPTEVDPTDLFAAMDRAENEKMKELAGGEDRERQLKQLEKIRKEYELINSEAKRLVQNASSEQAQLSEATESLRRMKAHIQESIPPQRQNVALMQQLDDMITNQVDDLDEYEKLTKRINEDLKDRIVPLRQEVESLKEQNEAVLERVRSEAALAEIQRQVSDRMEASTLGDPVDIQNQINMTEAAMNVQEQASKRAETLRRVTEGAGQAMLTGIPILMTYKGVMDGTMTSAQALQTVMGGLGMTLLMMPHPLAKVAGGLMMVVSIFADFRTQAEKLKETNEDLLRSFMALSETAEKNLSTIRGMKDSYNEVLSMGKTAEEILATESDENKEKYRQLADLVATTSPELVKYYNAEGDAIIDLSKDYQELYNARSEDVRLTQELLAQNVSGFATQYSAELKEQSTAIAENRNNLIKYQEELRKAQEQGNSADVAENLKLIQESTLALTDALTATNDIKNSINSNIIQPIISSNEALESFKQLGDEGIAMANKMSELGGAIISPVRVTGALERGDIDAVQEYQKVLDSVFSEIQNTTEAVKDNQGEIVEYNSTLLESYLKIAETDPAKFSYALAKSNGEISVFKDVLNSTSSTFDSIQKDLDESRIASLNFREEYAEIGPEMRKTDKEMMAASTAVGALGGAVVGVGLALAPFTAGLSAVAAGAVVATGAVVGGITAASIALAGYWGVSRDVKTEMREMDKAESLNIKNRWELVEVLNEASKTQEGFNKQMANVKGLNENIKAVEETIACFADLEDGLKALEKEAPKAYGEMLERAEKMADGTQTAFESLVENYELITSEMKYLHSEAIAALMFDNNEYYTHWLDKNAELVNGLAINYGIDAKNYSTLQEFKTALDNLHVSEFIRMSKDRQFAALLADQGIMQSSADASNTMSNNWNYGTQNALKGFDWLSSESLTIGDKIVVGMLGVVDLITGGFAGGVNVIIGFFGKIVDTIQKVVIDTLTAIKPLVTLYNKVTGEDLEANLNAGRKRTQDSFSAAKLKGTNLAENAALDRAAYNDRVKTAITNEIIMNTDNGAFAAMDGYNRTFDSINPTSPFNKAKNGGDTGGKNGDSSDKDSGKDVKDLELELNRYYKLENALSIVEDKLADISRAKDTAYGDDKIKLMDREQAQYSAQIKLLQQYQAELEKERAEKRKTLASNGFTFDSSGEITNLNERLTALQNAANKLSGDAKEQAIERVKKLQEEASRYNEIHFNLIPDKKQAIEDLKVTIKEVQREKIEYRIKLVVDKQEAINEIREVMGELYGDDYDKLDEKMILSKKDMEDSMAMYKYYQDELERIKKDSNLTDADRQDLIQKYTSAMYSSLTDAKKAYESISEAQLEFISQTSEMLTESSDAFDKIAEKATTLADTYKTVYGDQQYKQVAKLRDVQIEALEAQYETALRAQKEMIIYRDTLKKGTEEWKEANSVVEELGETIQSSLVDKISALQDKFTEFMESLMRVTEREVFGSLGLEGMTEQLERARAQQDKYLNGFEKISKIGEQIAIINEAIAETTDPDTAAKYQKFRERELETLLKADKVSEAELERAKLLWDIELKKQAMEERKNIQRQAQLVRDQNGNMSYEYITTSEKDPKKASELARANQSLYEFDVNQAKAAQDKVLEVVGNTQKKIMDLYNDTTLTEAERAAAIDIVLAQSKEDLAEAQQDMLLWTGKALEDGMNTIKSSVQNGGMGLGAIGISDEDANELFNAMDQGIISVEQMLSGNVEDLASYLGKSVEDTKAMTDVLIGAIIGEIGSTTQQLIESSNNWTTAFGEAMGTLETQYLTTQGKINDATNKLTSSTGNLTSEIDKNRNAFNQNMKTIQEQSAMMEAARRITDNTSNSYQNLTEKLIGKNGKGGTLEALAKVRDEMNQRLKLSLEITKDRTDKLSASAGNSKTGATTTLNSMASAANNSFMKTKQFDSQTILTANANVKNMGTYANTAAKNVEDLGNKSVSSRSNIASLSTALAALPGLNNNKYHYYTVTHKDGSITSERSKEKLSNPGSNKQYVGYFDTGGMYGSWTGSSGNQTPIPAFLHEKELVLNKEDTKNFLEGIMAQRDMLRQYSGMGMEGIIKAIGLGGATTYNTSSQEVHIHAEFPNATSSNEIQDAFRGLALRANTYANRE